MNPTRYAIDPEARGWCDGKPCGECGQTLFDVVRESKEVEAGGGEVVRTVAISCQCPRYYGHRRLRAPFGLEVLGTFDTASGEMDLFSRPILASEMEPDAEVIEHGPDVIDACPSWEGDEPPTLAGVLVARDWDGDVSKTIIVRSARDIASDVVAIDRPPPVGTSTRPPLSGRAIWHKRADGVPFECPKGVPHDALGWGFEGDDAWRPLRTAKEAGVIVLKAPGRKSREKPASSPMEAFAR